MKGCLRETSTCVVAKPLVYTYTSDFATITYFTAKTLEKKETPLVDSIAWQVFGRTVSRILMLFSFNPNASQGISSEPFVLED